MREPVVARTAANENVEGGDCDSGRLERLERDRDAAVVGLKDDDLGRRVHALIEPANADAPPAVEELDAHLRLHLASYKLPRGYEIVAQLPRDEAGKIRRTKLRDDRGG